MLLRLQELEPEPRLVQEWQGRKERGQLQAAARQVAQAEEVEQGEQECSSPPPHASEDLLLESQ